MKLSYPLATLMLLSSATYAQSADPAKAMRDAANDAVILKNYPAASLAAGEQGSVFFLVSMAADGEPTGCEVTRSSGYPRLDEATCRLMLVQAKFAKKQQPGATRSQVMRHEGVVNWKIPGAAADAAKPIQVASVISPMDKKVCKKTTEIGTLARVTRTCLTRREWLTQSDESRQPWEEWQGRKGMTTGD